MAQSRTNLNQILAPVIWLISLLFLTQALMSQTPSSAEESKATFRTLSLIAPINDLLYDYEGEVIPVRARTSSFSSEYSLPKSGDLVFYRMLPPAEGEAEPQRLTVAEIKLDKVTGSLFIFMTEPSKTPNQIKTFIAQDSWEAHPLETIQIFNLSERHTMVKLDTEGEVKLLGPGESAIYPYPESGSKQALLNVATREGDNEWELRIGGPQLTQQGTRSTLALVDEQATAERPLTEDLFIRKLIERAPPPQE